MKFFLLLLVLNFMMINFSIDRAEAQVTVSSTGQISGTPDLPVAAATPVSTSGPTANSAAVNEQGNNNMMGGVSIAMGGAMMVATCFNPTLKMLCFVGASAAMQGAMNLMQGSGRSATIDPTMGNPTTPCANGSVDLNCSDSLTNTTGTSGLSGFDPSAYGPGVQSAWTQAQDLAKANGMDLTNPSSIDAAKAAAGGDGGGASGLSMNNLPPYVEDAVQKAKADYLAKYSVSGVPLDGSSGGLRRSSANDGESEFDINKLLGKKDAAGGRNPASIDGLQKSLNGELVGVAGDNIFKQITRRYQSKIQQNTFLVDAPATVMGLKSQTKHLKRAGTL